MDTATQRLMAAAGSGPISGDPAWVDDVFKEAIRLACKAAWCG